MPEENIRKKLERSENIEYVITLAAGLLARGSRFDNALTQLKVWNDSEHSGSEEIHRAYGALFESIVFKRRFTFFISKTRRRLRNRPDLETIGQAGGSTVGAMMGSKIAAYLSTYLFGPLAYASNCFIPAVCMCCCSFGGKQLGNLIPDLYSLTQAEKETIEREMDQRLMQFLNGADNPGELMERMPQVNLRYSKDIDTTAYNLYITCALVGEVNVITSAGSAVVSGAAASSATLFAKYYEIDARSDVQPRDIIAHQHQL